MYGGTNTSIGNSQCNVCGQTSGSTKSGTALTTTLDISFRAGFAGLKNTYLFTGDKEGNTSGWQTVGTCQTAPPCSLTDHVCSTSSRTVRLFCAIATILDIRTRRRRCDSASKRSRIVSESTNT